MNESQLLDELVAPFDSEPGDWADVLRRAQRRRPRRRLALAAVAFVAALATATAVAVPLLRSAGPKLPSAADRRNVFVVVQPRTGRVLIEAAPWKGHSGICYLFLGRSAGCTLRGERKTMILRTAGYVLPSGRHSSALWGYTFDPRVASAKVYYSDNSHRRVPLHRLGGRLQVTFIGPVLISSRGTGRVLVYDRAGRLIKRD
ncbi:MAG: hypothetical protein ACXVRJ_14800 [Gaiellaceae bacterium]